MICRLLRGNLSNHLLVLGRERICKHGWRRILTLFHEFMDIRKVRTVLGEMILFASQAWKLEFLLSLIIIARIGFFKIGLALLDGCILFLLIAVFPSIGFRGLSFEGRGA